jgi:DNA-binding winged helix-turn-helix (wHTH) protein/tetratricopeptide (TPR) repeat protein
LVYLFDSYVLDDENLCLTRDGQRIPLEPRALGVLLLMVRSNGMLLRKEAILEAVWKNTVVEESTLSRIVAILRKQLRDDPRQPTFIETVPTFGYRFIAKVDTRPADALVAPAVEESAASSRLEASLSPKVSLRPEASGRPEGSLRPAARRWIWPLGAALLFLTVAVAVGWYRSPHPQQLQKQSIVLADFANSTGEGVFDGTLRQAMFVQLEQSPVLTLVPESRIRATVALMGQAPDARLTPALWRELCQRSASAAVLEGSIARLGSQYVVGLRATQCRTGDVIDTEQVQASRREDVLRALDDIASRFRGRVGESLSSMSSLDTPLDEATTPSLEALKAFSEANRIANLTGSAAAIPLLERAIALDPQFAIAHAMLGRVYGDVGQESRSAQSTAEAYKFRSRASERERFFIVASYDMQVSGNLEKAEETCETWARAYPRDDGALGFRTGVILRVFGQYEEAAELGRQLIDLDPDFAVAYHLLFVNEIALGRLHEARAVLDAAAARKLEIPFYALDRYRLAVLQKDTPAVERAIVSAARLPVTEDLIAGQQASMFAYHGRLRDARDATAHAVSLAVQSGRPELAARFEASAAITEALVGDPESAARHAHAALELSTGRDAEYGAAAALALIQKPTDSLASSLADDLEKRFPEDSAVRFLYLPTIRALLALNRGDPAGALELLKASGPYEKGTPPSGFLGLYGTLYPTFVRGLSYRALHRDAEAARAFQDIVDHPALTGSDPIGALAYLELGRALEGGPAADRTQSQKAYATFLALWKNADREGPTWTAARSEYSRL